MALNKEIICWKFGGPAGCPFGDKCIFNHNNKEASVAAFYTEMSRRKQKPCLQKPCWRFGGPDGCPFDDKCRYDHNNHAASIAAFSIEMICRNPPAAPMAPVMPVMPAKVQFAPKPCWRFGGPKGCRFGDNCMYSHLNKNASMLAFDAEKARRNEQRMMQGECNYTPSSPSSLTETTASSSGDSVVESSTPASVGGDSAVENATPASSSSDDSKAIPKIDEKYYDPGTKKLRREAWADMSMSEDEDEDE